MDKVCWGIVGCGDVTERKSGPALNNIEDSELVAVMRRDGSKAEEFAKRHGVPRWYDDADALINDAQVNAVYVATPPSSHAEYTIKAAQAGKAVYVEKPMALNSQQCNKMIKACDEASAPLFVAYYRRALPDFLKVKELVDSGAIGEPRLVSIELYQAPNNEILAGNLPWRVIPEIAGGGYFFDLASHQLDYLDYVFGPITSVQGHAANQAGLYTAEDAVSANFEFDSGVLGSGLWCFTVAENSNTDRIQIIGSKGNITFSCFDVTAVKLETEAGVEEFEIPRPKYVQQPLLQTVVDDLLGRGNCPSTGVTGARTSRVMDEIVRSYVNTAKAI